jgi:protein-S-isoprenylcysteine O-methyltransferase Ste14
MCNTEKLPGTTCARTTHRLTAPAFAAWAVPGVAAVAVVAVVVVVALAFATMASMVRAGWFVGASKLNGGCCFANKNCLGQTGAQVLVGGPGSVEKSHMHILYSCNYV